MSARPLISSPPYTIQRTTIQTHKGSSRPKSDLFAATHSLRVGIPSSSEPSPSHSTRSCSSVEPQLTTLGVCSTNNPSVLVTALVIAILPLFPIDTACLHSRDRPASIALHLKRSTSHAIDFVFHQFEHISVASCVTLSRTLYRSIIHFNHTFSALRSPYLSLRRCFCRSNSLRRFSAFNEICLKPYPCEDVEKKHHCEHFPSLKHIGRVPNTGR